MTETSLAKKLRLEPGMKSLVIGAPSGYIEQLGLTVDTNLSGKNAHSFDFAQIFVKTSGEVSKVIPELIKILKTDALFWISYPKGSSKVKTDLNRDIIWKQMEEFRISGIALVSIDDVWSAMRFRPADKVGK